MTIVICHADCRFKIHNAVVDMVICGKEEIDLDKDCGCLDQEKIT